MQREYSFDTAAVSYSSYCESFAYATVLLGDNCTLEYLDTELVAFCDAYVYLMFSSWFSDILVSAYPPCVYATENGNFCR